ncbi:MAG: serine/threonine protein kinase [Pleurocapsa sp.]
MKIELGSIIKNRYRLLCCLGRGNTAVTYQAEDLQMRSLVAMKIVSLRDAEDWQTLELFEGEAKTFAGLDHPQIPKYLDYFEIDTQSDRYFCLIRESIEGLSLAELVNSNYQLTEQSVCAIARKVLEILKYLHGFTPSIIHRDIQPDNILRTSNGSVYLIDFGAASSIYSHHSSNLDTFVGTLGYVPPEQFMGKVLAASDLYSLGCVVLFL